MHKETKILQQKYEATEKDKETENINNRHKALKRHFSQKKPCRWPGRL